MLCVTNLNQNTKRPNVSFEKREIFASPTVNIQTFTAAHFNDKEPVQTWYNKKKIKHIGTKCA